MSLQNIILTCVLSSFLVACGGGGNDNSPPRISSVTIVTGEGSPTVGGTLTGRYVYSDSDNDSEGASTYRWLRDGVAIAGATDAAYVLVSADADRDIVFEVTPVASTGVSIGSIARSVAIVPVGLRAPNQSPEAEAGSAQTVTSTEAITLNGTDSTDSDGTIVSYRWAMTASNPTIAAPTLTGGTTASASLTAPTVTAATTLTYTLTVTDNDGATNTDTVVVTITPAPSVVTISGKITFEKLIDKASGLDYINPVVANVRKARVEALDSNGRVLASTITNSTGAYSVTINANTGVRIRVKAELPDYNLTVVDNTNSQGLYALVGSLINSGSVNSTRSLHAPSGWNSSTNSYTSDARRASAPFAILDSLYLSSEKVKAADASATFSALKVNWSPNNVPSSGDKALGQIGTSHYDGAELYILGKENNDTDEFDDHVMIHEWGHYFEAHFSRSDSMGGRHAGGDILDMRIAFGEAWGNALSGIVTDDPVYADTNGAGQAGGFDFNIENRPENPSNPGFYSEGSLERIIYDLYDSSNIDEESTDLTALGFGPIYNVMIGKQKSAEAYTSIFTFINALKVDNPEEAANIDSVVTGENMTAISDIFGSNQIDDRGGDNNVLPIYTVLTPNGASVNRCAVKTFDLASAGNRLSIRRYFRFNITTAGNYQITVSETSNSGFAPDLDLTIAQVSPFVRYKIVGEAVTGGNETIAGSLIAGPHVMEIYDYASTQGAGGDVCFDVKIESVP